MVQAGLETFNQQTVFPRNPAIPLHARVQFFSVQRHMALARSLSKPESRIFQIQRINAMATSSYRQGTPKEELNKDRYIIH